MNICICIYIYINMEHINIYNIFLYEPMMVEHCDSLKQDDCAAGDGLGSTENYDDVDVDMPRVSKDSEKSPVERFVTLQQFAM